MARGMFLAHSAGMLVLLISLSCAQREPTKEELEQINLIWGNGSDPVATTQKPLDQFVVETTTGQLILHDDKGVDCKCVPYFMCNPDTNTIDYDPDETGYGVLDIRFGEDRCKESAEVCCKEPLDKPRPPPVTAPTATKCGLKGPVEFQLQGSTGHEAGFGELRWTVALLLVEDNDNICVGSLIHPQVVLTAAHCALNYEKTPNKLKIRAGEWDTQTEKERLPYQERAVQNVVVHERYNKTTLYYDVALLHLESPVELAQHIGVVCLPPQGRNDEAAKGCLASGWGKDIFGKGGAYAVIMKKIKLDCVEQSLCELLLQRTRLRGRFRLHPSFICAGGKIGEDTCQGDGGAPLACPMATDQFYQAGIVSWGIGCGQREVPAAYARVALFRDWIDQIVSSWGYNPAVYTAEL